MNIKRFSLVLALLVSAALPVQAQISITFDAFPYQNISDPARGLEDAEVFSNTTTIAFSYPFMFNENRTQANVDFSWERRGFDYRGLAGSELDLEALYASEVSLMLTHRLSETWSLLGIVTPGLASDLRGKLTAEDFSFQAVLAGIRRTSPQFAFGMGAAYSTQFGEPIPLPVLLFDWNNGKKLRWMTILPVSSEVWYAHSARINLGILLNVKGNNFHADPDRYTSRDPQVRYSVVTLGPSVRFSLAPGLALQIDAGVVPYHRLQFYDGSTEVESFRLKESAFLRLGFSFGGWRKGSP